MKLIETVGNLFNKKEELITSKCEVTLCSLINDKISNGVMSKEASKDNAQDVISELKRKDDSFNVKYSSMTVTEQKNFEQHLADQILAASQRKNSLFVENISRSVSVKAFQSSVAPIIAACGYALCGDWKDKENEKMLMVAIGVILTGMALATGGIIGVIANIASPSLDAAQNTKKWAKKAELDRETTPEQAITEVGR